MSSRQSLAKLQSQLKASVNQKLGTSYKTITQFKKHFGLNSNDETWDYLDQYVKDSLKPKKLVLESVKVKRKTFLVHITLEIRYKNKKSGEWSNPYIEKKVEGPFKEFYPQFPLKEQIKKWTLEESGKKIKVIDSKIEYFDKKN